MKAEEYERILAACGGAQTPLAADQREAWLQAWREVYAVGLYAATGRWTKDGFEWHVFSFQHARAHNGARALAAYEAEPSQGVVVCPESRKLPAVRLEGNRLPAFAGLGGDVLISPLDCAWTMAFTHEETLDLGPYFSRREWIVTGRDTTPRP
jgi:hypothetical protein